jgi:hypothetical protein
MPRPWVGLYLFPAYLRKHPYLFRWFKDEHMIRDRSFFRTPFCRGVALLDEGIQKSLAWHIAPHKVHVLPDVANIDVTPDAPPLTQALLQQAAGRPIIGLLGVLGRRKGTLPYLRAMHQIKDNRCFFLLAGQLGSAERKTYGQDEPELDQLLSTATQQKNTFIHLGHIENEETINSLVSACTILYLAYDGHQHSSGILGKAAHFKKLVIGPATGCVADRIRKFKIGLTIKAGSDTETIKAVKTLSHAPSYAKLWNQARFTAYQAQHNCESLDRSLTALLKDIP